MSPLRPDNPRIRNALEPGADLPTRITGGPSVADCVAELYALAREKPNPTKNEQRALAVVSWNWPAIRAALEGVRLTL